MTDKNLQVHEKQEAQAAGETTKPGRQFIPAVDIYETDEAVTLRADMPGVDNSGISIDLEKGVLTITGTMNGEENPNEKMLLKEYESGHYMRRFTISEAINQEKIEATIADGVLTLVLPKVTPAKPRKIEVKAG